MKTKNPRARLALFVLVGTAALGALGFAVLRPARSVAAPLSPQDEEGSGRLGPPNPGEWRDRFKEPPQSFQKYAGGSVNRRSDVRTTFYIQPLGEAGASYRKVLERMRVYTEAFFGVPAKVLDSIPLYEPALAPRRSQYDASSLIRHLSDRVPKDALVYIGIADQDLYSEGLNFVFGQATLHWRCGVYSLVRYETDDDALFTRRSLNLLAHESGHILSIEHCVTYACVMQGANSLQEHDSHPMHLCPIDLQKVLWNTGLDWDERYRKLLPLYREWGLAPEALWVTDRLAR